jgi:hypothetical protein
VRFHSIFLSLPGGFVLHAALKERESGYRETPLPAYSDSFALNPHLPLITLLRVTADLKNFKKLSLSANSLAQRFTKNANNLSRNN